MSELIESLKEDPVYEKTKNIYKSVTGMYQEEKIVSEIDLLHSTRKARKLITSKVSPKTLQEAILIEMSNRSRLIELRSLCSRNHQLISSAREVLKKHILCTYPRILKAEYGSTIGERNNAVDSLLSRFFNLQSRIEGTINMIDLAVKDIDQSSYQFRNLIDIMKIVLGGGSSNLETM